MLIDEDNKVKIYNLDAYEIWRINPTSWTKNPAKRHDQKTAGIGFEFKNFKPQLIFQLIQKVAPEVGGVIGDDEMLKTFNLGWGFAIIIDKDDVDQAISIIEKCGEETEVMGYVTDSKKIIAYYKNKKYILKS